VVFCSLLTYGYLLLTGPPEPPVNCSLVNQTTASLMVQCAPGFDGGLPQTFRMEVVDLETGVVIGNRSENDPEFEVRYLEVGHLLHGMRICRFPAWSPAEVCG